MATLDRCAAPTLTWMALCSAPAVDLDGRDKGRVATPGGDGPQLRAPDPTELVQQRDGHDRYRRREGEIVVDRGHGIPVAGLDHRNHDDRDDQQKSGQLERVDERARRLL